MSIRNERVAAMVRAELAKDGKVENAALLKKARTIDPKLRRLTARQFHGTYRLPALREAKRALRSTTGAAAPATAKKTSPTTRGGRRRSAAEPQATAPTSAPTSATTNASPPASSGQGKRATRRTSASAPASSSAAAREAVRQVLQTVAREAMAVEDRASFIRLLDSLDQRAEMILSVAGRG
jgi:hypothetical protein